ncbi:hypothetical protein FRC04_001095 [Tulasnella sp. 424]|nr:hypothetical protein FRC04_001095 [Tulasnella sp. 424]
MEGQACLWTQIWASDGLEYVRKAFIKSKDTPIDLRYQEGGGAADLMRVETFLQEASPHVARWRSLCIYSYHQQRNWEGALALLHAKPIPNLEKLVIFGYACTEMRSIDLIAITVGDAASPKLKNIRIARAPVTIHATTFTTLRSFALDRIPGSSLHEILGVLQNSPQLKRLALGDGQSLKVAEQDWSVRPIRFERLGAVELRKLPASVTNFILSIVHAPNCRSLIIACEIRDPSTLFNASVSHLLLPFKEGGLMRPPVDVVVGNYTRDRHVYITIRVGYMEIDIRGFVDGASALDSTLRWIGDYSGSEGSFQASLELACRYSDPGYVEAFGPQFSVKRRSIYEDGILEYLSHPGQQGGWPFPQLENLKCPVGRDQTHIPLLNLLTARYGHGGAEQSVGVETLTPLRSIKLLCRGPPPNLLIQQIQEILSDVEIICA